MARLVTRMWAKGRPKPTRRAEAHAKRGEIQPAMLLAVITIRRASALMSLWSGGEWSVST
jgi:hypothetical protein